MSATILKPGGRVQVVGNTPHSGCVGTLVAFERYGLGSRGWRVKLDNGFESYQSPDHLEPIAQESAS